MKKTEFIKAENASWSKSALASFNKARNCNIKQNSQKTVGYDELRKAIIVREEHKKANVKLDDDFIKWINPDFNLQVLYRFNNAFKVAESVNLYEAALVGKLPFSSFNYFGQYCVEMIKDTKNKKEPKKYNCKLNKDSVSKLDSLVVSGQTKEGKNIFNDVDGGNFNQLIDKLLNKKSNSPSDYDKMKKAINALIRIGKNHKLSDTRRLEIKALINTAEVYFLPKESKKPVKKVVSKIVKKAA